MGIENVGWSLNESADIEIVTNTDLIPKFITGTEEERIAQWKAYKDAGIVLINTSEDKDENWIEYGELTGEDFLRCGFSCRCGVNNWESYVKPNINRIAYAGGDTWWNKCYIKYFTDTKRMLVQGDLTPNTGIRVFFDGVIKTNYEFYQLMKQLNIVS